MKAATRQRIRLCRCPSLIAHLDRLAAKAVRERETMFHADDDCGASGPGRREGAR